MYQSKMVVALRANGQILREQGDIVRLPFGAEYSIYLKNLNNVRAVVKIEIDGRDVLNGDELVVNANSHIDLERFLDGNNHEGRRFKFIERTGEIEAHRGIEAEDGIIRVSYRFEVQQPRPQIANKSILRGSLGSSGDFTRGFNGTGASDFSGAYGATLNSVSPTSFNASSIIGAASAEVNCAAPLNDAGITVEGSKSTQSFTQVYVGALEQQEHVIVLKLSGYIDNQPVAKPVTVKSKKVCSSCGTAYPATAEYCSKDGTYLRFQEVQNAMA